MQQNQNINKKSENNNIDQNSSDEVSTENFKKVVIRHKKSNDTLNTISEEKQINEEFPEEETKEEKEKFYLDIKVQTKVFAVLLMIFSVLLFFALISHTTKDDFNTQFSFSDITGIFTGDPAVKFKIDTTVNLLGLVGAYLADFFINGFIGIFAIGFPVILFLWARSLFKLGEVSEKLIIRTNIYILFSINISFIIGALTLFSSFENIPKEFYGTIGIFVPTVLSRIIFPIGTLLVFLGTFVFLIYKFTTIKTIGIKKTVNNIIAPVNPKILISKLNAIVNKEEENKYKEEKISENSAPEVVTPVINTINTNHTINTNNINNINNTNKQPAPEEKTKIIEESYEKEKEIPNNKIVKNIFETDTNNENFSLGSLAPAKNIFDAASTRLEDEMLELERFRNKVNIKIIQEPVEEMKEDATQAQIINKNIANIDATPIQTAPEQVIPEQVVLEREIALDVKTNAQILANPPVNLDIPPEVAPMPPKIENINFLATKGAPAVSTAVAPLPSLILDVEPQIKPAAEDKIVLKNPLSVSVHDEKINYTSPLLNLLDVGSGENYADDEELQRNGQILQEKLQQFKINISNLEVTKGPVVTQYEFIPADGIKISKVEGLADDLTMALKAKSVRIIAPVPEKGTVGIQIPNANPSVVRFRSVAASAQFINNNFELPIALGKTVSGEPLVADLAKMPHLLIAGSTGSGKSVGINTIITSLLFRKHPSQLKFLIVDPKKVELQQYSRLSNHFLAISPDIKSEIVTEPVDAITALKAVVLEMEKRYTILAKVGQRNIKDYNEKVAEGAMRHIKDFDHRALPYIVVVIDELADLMLTAGREVETPIVRLAQMARAVGIHLIIATQRPSVNVITGVIKANFPARIAYLVAQKVDSRTILDSSGAEALLGNGDMLFQPSNQPKPIRVQNPFISTDEVERICEFIGNQQGYSEPYLLPSTFEAPTEGEYDVTDFDPLFREAAELIIEQQQASTSMLQRRLKIGFARAGRIIDELEAAKVIGPSQGSKPRAVFFESISELDKIL